MEKFIKKSKKQISASKKNHKPSDKQKPCDKQKEGWDHVPLELIEHVAGELEKEED